MNVVLSTLNSKFIHSSLALRYLKAYGEAHGQAYDIVEYTINMPVLHILGDITEHDIDVLGFCLLHLEYRNDLACGGHGESRTTRY